MKKTTLLIILGTAISLNGLYAQSERNRDTGTNQGTGNRVQVTGAEMEKSPNINCNTNQGTGYREQGTGLKRTELLSEDQIRQRTKITKNYELRTANCNNSAESLNCYPMMDPSTVEEGIKAVEKTLGFSERSAIAAEGMSEEQQTTIFATETRETPVISIRAASSEDAMAVMANLSPQLRGGGSSPTLQSAEAAKENAKIAAKAAQQKGSAIHSVNERNEKSAWENAVSSYNETAEAFDKTIIAIASEDECLAMLWLKTANQHQEFAEHCWNQAEYLSLGRYFLTDGDILQKILRPARAHAEKLKEASTSLLKATQAREANHEELAALWFQIMEQNQQFADYHCQVAKIRASENYIKNKRLSDYTIEYSSAERLKKASTSLEKATQATVANQKELATLWLKTAQQNQEAAKYYFQAAIVNLSEPVLMLAEADEKQGVDGAQKLSVQKLLDASSTDATKLFTASVEHEYRFENRANYNHCIHVAILAEQNAKKLALAATALEKAIEAETAGKLEEAQKWREVVNQYLQSVQACVTENQIESTR